LSEDSSSKEGHSDTSSATYWSRKMSVGSSRCKESVSNINSATDGSRGTSARSIRNSISSRSELHSKKSQTISSESDDEEESLQSFRIRWPRPKFKLARSTQSLAEKIKDEEENQQEVEGRRQIQENLIDHLAGFSEQNEVPGISGNEELEAKFHIKARNSQQHSEHLSRENSSPKAEIKDTHTRNNETEKKVVPSILSQRKRQLVRTGKESAGRSDQDRHKGREFDQQNVMATVNNLLHASKDEHDIGKEELINIIRALNEKANQLELETGLIELDKRRVDQKILKTRNRLYRRKKHILKAKLIASQSRERAKSSLEVADGNCSHSLLHTYNRRNSKVVIKNNSRETELNLRKTFSRVKHEFLDDNSKSYVVSQKDRRKYAERPKDALDSVQRSKHKCRSSRKKKTSRRNVDAKKTRFRQTFATVERAFTRKDSNLKKEMRDFFRNVTPAKVIV
jgi:hypothetical protein